MKKAALFPFNRDLLPVVRHFSEMQDQYRLTELIAMPGTGLAGKDAGAACNHPKMGINVVDQVNVESQNWEALMLAWDFLQEGYNIRQVITGALSCKKEIIVLVHSDASVPEWLIAMKDSEAKVTMLSFENVWKEEDKVTDYEGINASVILVGGIVEEADVLEVTIAVSKALKDMGLVVAAITKEATAQIFGFWDFTPLYEKLERAAEKISVLNQAVQIVEQKLVPDVIVIEAPDAIIRYNDIAPNGFGIHTYMLCQAVSVDTLICCVPYDLAQIEFLRLLNKDFKTRYGTEIGMVHASNVLIDSLELLSSKQITCFYDSFGRMESFIEGMEPDTEIPVLNTIIHSERLKANLHRLLFSQEDKVDEQ